MNRRQEQEYIRDSLEALCDFELRSIYFYIYYYVL